MFVQILLSVFKLLALTFTNFVAALYDLKNGNQGSDLFLFFLDSVEGERTNGLTDGQTESLKSFFTWSPIFSN